MAARAFAIAGLVVAPLLAAAGCGEPLLTADAYDSPLISLHGNFNPARSDLLSPRVGVVWVDPAELDDDVPAPPQAIGFQLSDTSFDLRVYAPPPAGAIRALRDPEDGDVITSFAFGELVVFEDRNEDGTFSVTPLGEGSTIVPPDLYRGAQSLFVLTYVQHPLQAPDDVLPELHGLLAVSPGYHLGVINCATPDAPRSGTIDNPEAQQLEMTILAQGTPDLPFVRSCLRTHPVPPPAMPTP
jgi:hypothetical protein